MPEPTTNPLPATTIQRVAPWVIFTLVLLAAVVGFFLFADRVPSLLQALADK